MKSSTVATMTAFELFEQGLLSDAANLIDEAPTVSSELSVLRAFLESQIGLAARANAAARELLRQPLNPREIATCREVIGRTTLSSGDIKDGLREFAKAFNAAAATEDPKVEARLRASYAEALLHCAGLEAAELEIPKLRHAALRAGDAFTLVAFHSLNAEIHAKRGLLREAASSIEIARGLLEKFPNVAQQARLAVIASGLAAARCDLTNALRNATEGLEYSAKSGLRIVRLPALNNIVYVKLAQKDFEEARRYLRELLSGLQERNSTEIGYRDTEMMLALASDDLALAGAVANTIANLVSTQENQDRYYKLWYLPNHVRWLYRVQQVEHGVNQSLDGIAQVIAIGDQTLLARLRFLAADGLSRLGRTHSANAMLTDAVRDLLDPSLELLAEGLRVAGRLSASEDAVAARSYFTSSSRILSSIGNLALKDEVDREAINCLPQSAPAHETPALARIIERISTLVDLGRHVPTLALEVFSLIVDSGAAMHCTLSVHDGQRRPETLAEFVSDITANTTVARIVVGTYGTQQYELTYRPKPQTAAHVTLLGIERLLAGALAINDSRQRRKELVAVFSGATPEQQLGLICSSERMTDLVKTIRRVAAANVTVLLTGETGVGKELFARALHQASARSDKTFLPFNCGTVARELFDSQLFGHRRGAFTGANADAPGVIRSAAGGTLFLDEIGEMAIDTQPKLLRFLESGEILALGDTKPQTVDVRIVAATNANLDQMVADGRFREDLYYRLNVIRINIPPLRERREEIPALVEHFLERFGREQQKSMLRVADETLEYLVLYRWPGNVRQLANELRRLVALAEPGAVLMPAHLSDDIVASRRTMPVGHAPRGFSEVVTRIDQPLSAAVEHIERAAIQRALSMTDGNVEEAARMLGLSRKGLYLKRQRLQLG